MPSPFVSTAMLPVHGHIACRKCFVGEGSTQMVGNTRGKIASRIMLPASSCDDFASIVGDYDSTAPTPAKMSRGDVELYLDVPYEDIVGLIDCGLLKAAPPDRGRLIDGESVRITTIKVPDASPSNRGHAHG